MVQANQDSNNPYASPEGDFTSSGEKEEDPESGTFATFWRRFFALFIDCIILRILLIPVSTMIAVVLTQQIKKNALNRDDILLFINLFDILLGLLISWLYFAIQESSEAQATFGKKLLGIRVVDGKGRRISLGRATGRFFGRFLSGIPMGLGYLIMPLTPKKQALHDLITGTVVIKG